MTTAPSAPTGALARILDANRTAYNARFAEAQRRYPKLDPSVFANHLHLVVEPIVAAVASVDGAAVQAAVDALYDLSLDLCGQELLGASARITQLNTVWLQLLPATPRLIALDPRRVIGALTNAAYNMSAESSTRPQQWIETMRSISAVCPDPASFLQAGQIAAWLSGMAHYRQPALALCRSLNPSILRSLLKLPASAVADIPTVLDNMSASPWYKPTAARQSSAPLSLQIVKCVGAFRGFGGLFLSPPTVASRGEDVIVSDGATAWLLTADAFGATFHHVESMPAANPSIASSGFKIVRGNVTKDGYSQVFPELEVVASLAATSTTLAVTTPQSHSIYLVALV